MTQSLHLARALLIRAADMSGAALAVLRADTMTGNHDGQIDAGAAKTARSRLLAYTPETMPPATDDLSLLLETASQRLGGISRNHVWQAIGLTSSRGRDLLARNARAVGWDTWFALRELAIGPVDAARRAAPLVSEEIHD